MWHALARRRIDRYFDGQLRPPSETRMRRHLPGCAECRARYERHLLAEEAMPDGERRAADRSWLGIVAAASAAAEAPPPARRARLAVPVLALAAGAALVVLVPQLRRSPAPVERGGPPGAASDQPELHLFGALPGGRSVPVGDRIRAGDGWLVAYSNPGTQARWLMVFAVDDACRVHWFYPPYELPGGNPTAIPIRTGENGVELGEEIRHTLHPGGLGLVGLFLARPLDVRAVEDAVRGGCGAGGASPAACTPLPLPAVHQSCRRLVVDP